MKTKTKGKTGTDDGRSRARLAASTAVRELPLLDEQLLSARVAKEIGDEKTAKACAKKAFAELIAKQEYVAAAETASEFGLEEENRVAMDLFIHVVQNFIDEEMAYLKKQMEELEPEIEK